MKNNLISIIIPTYNRAHLLKRAIDSVLKQTYDEWELIVVDDASTDNTSEIIQTFGNSKIIYIKNNRNLGGSGSRNVGLQLAKGRYITFLDSDDEYLPEKLEKQLRQFEISRIENLGVVTCGRYDYKDSKKYFTWVPKYKGNVLSHLLRKDRVGAGTPFLMIKRAVLEAGIFFDPQMPAGQDWDFVVRICQKFNMDFVAEPLVKVHHHKGERIYNNKSALAAFSYQYEKYKDLFIEDQTAHIQFVIKRAVLHFSYNDRSTALKLIKADTLNASLKLLLWNNYFKLFKNVESLPSRLILRILNLISFN